MKLLKDALLIMSFLVGLVSLPTAFVHANEAEGDSNVTLLRGSILLTISGDSARLVFNTLKTAGKTPPYSTSVIKETSEISCTKNGREFFCVKGLAATAIGSEESTRQGGVVSGGGGSTASEADGTSNVLVVREGTILTISGASAQLLFKSLKVTGKTPISSTSVIKETDEVSCTKNGREYFCGLSIDSR